MEAARTGKHWLCALLALGLSLCAPSAGAQSAKDRFWAEVRIRDGKNLLFAGRVAEACRKFEESQALNPRNSTLITLAECHEREGKTATAYKELETVEREGDPVQRQIAKRKRVSLERRVARLTIVAAETTIPGLQVRLDGVAVPEASWGQATLIDPGDHEVVAEAPGRQPWSSRVNISRGGSSTVTVPALESSPSTAPAAPPVAATAPTAAARPAPKPKPPNQVPDIHEPPAQVHLYGRAGATLYMSDARTAGGVGGGVGLRFTPTDWFLAQVDAAYLVTVGNVLQVRSAAGLQRPRPYTPAVMLGVSLLAGDQLSFFTDQHPRAIPGPAVTLELSVAPLRFRGDGTQVSFFEPAFGLGWDFPGLGISFGGTVMEVSTSAW